MSTEATRPTAKKAAAPRKKAKTEKETLREELVAKLSANFSVTPEVATHENLYNALALVLRDRMRTQRVKYISRAHKENAKQVYYMSMEFLMGRSLKNTLFNLNLTEDAKELMAEYGVKLETLYALEPDAGLGNGGLGRLANGTARFLVAGR